MPDRGPGRVALGSLKARWRVIARFLRRLSRTVGINRSSPSATVDAIAIDAIPRTTPEIIAAAAAIDMVVPAACIPGVVVNLAILDDHAKLLTANAAAPGL